MSPEHITTWPDVGLAIVNSAVPIIGAISALVAAVGAVWAAIRGNKAVAQGKESAAAKDEIIKKVTALEDHANGLTKALLDAKGVASHAEGVADEKAAAEKRLNEIRGESQA